jgi:hypothetical protein
MDSRKKTFEQQWEDALSNASEKPPLIVWENIEKELNKKNKRFAFLWFRPNMLGGGIAAALILGLGYFLFLNEKGKSPATVPLADMGATNLKKEAPLEPSVKSDKKMLEFNTQAPNYLSQEKIQNTNSNGAFSKKKRQNNINEKSDLKYDIENYNNIKNTVSQNQKEYNLADNSRNLGKVSAELPLQNDSKVAIKMNKISPIINPKLFGNRFVKREKLSYDLEEVPSETNSEKKNGLYLSFNSGLSPFNPNFKADGFSSSALLSAQNDANQVYSLKSAGNRPLEVGMPSAEGADIFTSNVPTNSFEPGRAINLGLNLGKKIYKNLGWESGFRFFRANSRMNTNVYDINAQNGAVNSFFQSNYLDENSRNTQTIISISETNRQFYNYLMIPAQLVYTIPLNKLVNIEVLAGFSGDFLMQNQFIGEASDIQIFNAQNSSFNLFNLSGLETLRINYELNDHWQLNIGGNYQHSLFSGTRKAENLNFRPTMFGVNYGMRYKF